MVLNKLRCFLIAFLFTFQLSAQEKPELVVSSGHNQGVNCVDISSNGKFIASGASDNLVKVYNLGMQQELNTLIEFTGRVLKVKFSPDNKYIVSSCFGNKLFIHSHPEGKLIGIINNKLSSEYFHLTSDGLIYVSGKKYLEAYSMETGEIVKTYDKIEINKRFSILPDDKTLVSPTQNEDGVDGLGFFSLAEETLSDFIAFENMIFTCNIQSTPDGKKVIFENKSGEYTVIDVKLKNVERVLKFAPNSIFLISPDSKQLISAGYDNIVQFWNLNTGEKTREIKDISPEGEVFSISSQINGMSFSKDGKMLAFAYQDLTDGKLNFTIEWFHPKTMKSIGKYFGGPKLTTSLAVDQENNLLVTGNLDNNKGVKCYDLSKCSQKNFFPGSAFFGYGGNNLFVFNKTDNEHHKLDVHRAPSLRKINSFELYGFPTAIATSYSGKYVVVNDQKHTPNEDLTKPQVRSNIRIWDVISGIEIVNRETALQDQAAQYLFSENEEELIIVKGNGNIELMSLMNGEAIDDIQLSIAFNYPGMIFGERGHTIIGATNSGLKSIDCKTGEVKEELLKFDYNFAPYTGAVSLDKSLIAISGWKSASAHRNYVQVYNWVTKELVCELIGHSAVVTKLVFDKNNNLYTVDQNGVVAIWNIADCKAKASFLSFGREDYIITTPDGFYKSTKGNIKNVAFRQLGELYTFDQFDLRFNRPDKVLESVGFASQRLIELYHRAYAKRLKRMGFSEDISSMSINAPEIEIQGIEDLPLSTASSSINISLNGTSANLPLDRLLVTVNNIPIYGRQGVKLKTSTQKTYTENIEIPLVAGKNTIQVSMMNTAGIESTRKTYAIECTKPTTKPNLYIIAIGISNYKDSSMNLTYSDKDARDLTTLFKENKGTNAIFNETFVQLFTNEEAMKENILAVKSKLLKSRPDDHVILFYSGHGVLDEQLDYYLSTHDLQFEQPNERGLNFDDFKDLIDSIPARQRLIFVDACHSGEVDKDEIEIPTNDLAQLDENKTLNSKGFKAKGKKIIGLGNTFELMQELFVELRKESGATIIASSAGKEYSLESPIWKNGVFTFVIKEGLIDKKGDLNNDKYISVSELKSYLFTRVQELTNGKQTPTVRMENLQMDYNIY